MTQYLTSVISITANVENAFVSVERCIEYTKLPKEAPPIIPDHRYYLSFSFSLSLSLSFVGRSTLKVVVLERGVASLRMPL